MCTVTFIPSGDKIFLTSNRDEKTRRSPALPPAFYPMRTGNILFPRDLDGGGTWFAIHENGNAVVFLNGAWSAHIPNPPYRKSRGLVLLDLIEEENPGTKFLSADFTSIEPFSAVIWQSGQLAEGRWDGKEKSFRHLAVSQPHIWSSVTLYPKEIALKREKWFAGWLQDNIAPSWQDIIDFHLFTGDGDKRNDLLMNRGEGAFTVSITSLEYGAQTARIKYLDFIKGKTSMVESGISNTMQYR